MKVRVIRNMPFAKIGEVFEVDQSILDVSHMTLHADQIAILSKEGWIEEVKDEILDDKIEKYLMNRQGVPPYANTLAQIARDHTLEVLDKAEDNYDGQEDAFCYIKNAIEQA